MKMLLCCYYCMAVLANEQFFFLKLDIFLPVKYCQIKDFIRQFHSLTGNTMLLALTTKDTFPIISLYYPYTFFYFICKRYCLRRTNICTCLAANTVLIIDNRFASEIFERDMRFFRKF